MLTRYLLAVVLSAATASAGASAEPPVFSGPQPGEPLPPLQLRGVYDELAGKTFDPVQQAAGKPTMLVFVHSLTRPGVALTRAITEYAHQQPDRDVVAAIVWLDDDQSKAESYLRRARKSLGLSVPVGISVDGAEGPGAYGLNRNVELTVLLAEEGAVFANFALVQPSVTEASKIAGELAELLDQPAPSQQRMESLAYPGQRDMRGKRNMRRRGAGGRADDSN